MVYRMVKVVDILQNIGFSCRIQISEDVKLIKVRLKGLKDLLKQVIKIRGAIK